MRTDPSPTPDRPAGLTPHADARADSAHRAATPPPAGAAAGQADPIEHLFRYASRAGQVHPLQHLLQRYRAGERA
jgi:hypothetical protein